MYKRICISNRLSTEKHSLLAESDYPGGQSSPMQKVPKNDQIFLDNPSTVLSSFAEGDIAWLENNET